MRRRRDRGEFVAGDRHVFLVWWVLLGIMLGLAAWHRNRLHDDIRIIKEAVVLYAPPAEPAEEVAAPQPHPLVGRVAILRGDDTCDFAVVRITGVDIDPPGGFAAPWVSYSVYSLNAADGSYRTGSGGSQERGLYERVLTFVEANAGVLQLVGRETREEVPDGE